MKTFIEYLNESNNVHAHRDFMRFVAPFVMKEIEMELRDSVDERDIRAMIANYLLVCQDCYRGNNSNVSYEIINDTIDTIEQFDAFCNKIYNDKQRERALKTQGLFDNDDDFETNVRKFLKRENDNIKHTK